MEEYLANLVQQYPQLVVVFLIIGVMRAVFKPLMAVIEAYVKATPKEDDDKKLEIFKSSKFYKSVVFVIDYMLSIKLPVPKPKVAGVEPEEKKQE